MPAVHRHRVREALQERILSGELPAGSKLVQQRLAEELGVSQAVVREAVLELQAYGLVDAEDHRGMSVARIEASVLLDAYDVREMLEGLVARRCCERATRENLRELAEAAEAIRRHALAGEHEEAAARDRGFHLRLIAIAGNTLLDRLSQCHRALGKVVRAQRAPDAVRDEHLAILAAIGSGEPDVAERVARAHIAIGKAAVARLLAEGALDARWVR